jgi:hypothetical protein
MTGPVRPKARRARVAVNLEIPFPVWERYHRLCRTRHDVSLHELVLALLNKTVHQRRLRDDRRGAIEKP